MCVTLQLLVHKSTLPSSPRVNLSDLDTENGPTISFVAFRCGAHWALPGGARARDAACAVRALKLLKVPLRAVVIVRLGPLIQICGCSGE